MDYPRYVANGWQIGSGPVESACKTVVANRLIDWMVHLCLRQFRVDTLSTVSGEIQQEHRETALDGLRPFSHDYLEEIADYETLHLVSGNKSAFKDPSALAAALFDYQDGRKRTHWENKPYRALYQRACTTLSAQPTTAGFVATLRRRLWRWLFAFHWVLPYPSVDVFMQTTKAGHRMWYSIRPHVDDVVEGDLAYLDPAEWQWAQKDSRPGYPPALPRYIRWTSATWEEWIRRQ